MADWFKFYNDSIDEPRLQWAVSEQAEVLPVWVLILSECSKHYSGTLSWRDKDYELLGYARKINVSPAKLNSALLLLVRIEYLEKTENHIKVLKWNEMQSIYCQRKVSESVHSVRTVSAHTPHVVPLEERRGEEIRREETSLRARNGDVFGFRTQIGNLFSRGEHDRWSDDEEHLLVEIFRRPKRNDEFEAIRKLLSDTPKDQLRFKATNVRQLLSKWTDLLDQTRGVKTVNGHVYQGSWTREKPPVRKEFQSDASYELTLKGYRKYFQIT